MRVIIIGAGRTGGQLVASLCTENHDVTVVDSDPRVLTDLSSQYDILTLAGSGCDPQILEEAGVEKCQLLVACTQEDETNILACACAKRAGVERTVCRISNVVYTQKKEWFSLEQLGVDVVISQQEESAREIYNTVMMPGSSEVVPMLDGKARIVGMKISKVSPLFGAKLDSFPYPDLLDLIRFVAIMRGGELVIPHGDTVFIEDDEVYILGTPSMTLDFIDWACPRQQELLKVVIAGGGSVGLPLAEQLEDAPVQVVVIEKDEKRASYCSSMLDRSLVLQGDALEEATLKEAGISEGTSFVAVLGNDESNILGCILAKQNGASFVVSQINKAEYSPIVTHLDMIDRVVNPNVTITNAILHMARWKNIEAYSFLQQVPGQLIEFVINAESKHAGVSVRDLKLPRRAVIAAVKRDSGVIIATGSTELLVEDRVVVFAEPEVVKKVQQMFA
tara:strand:+ start:1214 stop:2560 length:1347 start_codon:yes stop_codon:yes gene_type:complete